MEQGIIQKALEYGSYILIGIIGWFLRRYTQNVDNKTAEQDKKLEALEKRISEHDVSRAYFRAQIYSIHAILEKMDKNISKLLDK